MRRLNLNGMTDSDAKEWVTVKLPKEVRDDAQDDPRTYGEVMRAGLGADVKRVREVVEGAAQDPDDVSIERTQAPELPDDVREQLDRIESAQGGTVAEALDLAEVDPDAIADAVATRGVSLDVGERKAIAEEVVGMLR